MRRPDPARVSEFAATARKLQSERAESVSVVARLLRETPRAEWPGLAGSPQLRTTGAVERLGAEIEARLDRDPREALAIAELAASVAAALPDAAYPAIVLAQCRAHAWKDLGQALCYLARYDEALRALERGEEEVARFGTLAHDRAIVQFVKATVLQHRREFDLAERLLTECRAIFSDHGDSARHAKCTLALGNLRVRKGDYRGAREVLAPMISTATPTQLESVHIALGWCALHLDTPREALKHFEKTAQLCDSHGNEFGSLRATYGKGSALLRLGLIDESVATLHDARARFLDQNLVEEAGLAGLEIVEARLLTRDIELAKTLAATLVREFTSANLSRRAIAALAYLNEAIAASRATPEIARDVHAYLVALRYDPARDFAPTAGDR